MMVYIHYKQIYDINSDKSSTNGYKRRKGNKQITSASTQQNLSFHPLLAPGTVHWFFMPWVKKIIMLPIIVRNSYATQNYTPKKISSF